MTDEQNDEQLDAGEYVGRPGSLVMYHIGGRMYPMKTSSRCKVCNSPHRIRIEEEIVAGRGPTFILRNLPEGHNLSIVNVRNHFDYGHLPSDLTVVRELVDQRARERGEAIESGAASFVDGVTLLRTVMVKSFERIAKGELKVSVEHGLMAAQALEALGYADSQFDQSNYTEAVIRFFDAAIRNTDSATFEAIMRDVRDDPVLAAIARKEKGQPAAIESPGQDTSIP